MSGQGASSSPRSLQIAVVCDANVCRSPVVAFILGQSTQLHVASSGLNAREGSTMCDLAAERISGRPSGLEYERAFRAQSIEWAEVEHADLVLTATGELRAQLLANRPRLLRVTFTVLEAIALMAEPLDAAELEQAQRYGIAAVLFIRRGMIARPGVPNQRRKGRHDGFDIPDGHQLRRKSHHQATVDEAVRAAGQLQKRLLAWQLAVAGAGFSGQKHE